MKNSTMIQYFEWYLPADGKHWDRVQKDVAHLHQIGFDRIWLPPAYKGQGGSHDVGYGVYDLYDLGEFDQKGTIATKYGTKDAYIQAIQSCHENQLEVIADIVFNHRMGADQTETIQAKEINWNDRDQSISPEESVEVWTKFIFPGRKGKYSDFIWDWSCFTGTDYDARTKQTKLLEFYSKKWSENVSQEQGNYDYIMGDDVDFSNQKVVDELYHWTRWYKNLTGIDGFRLDAVKSIDSTFFPRWLATMRQEYQDDLFAVGEYWSGNLNELKDYLRTTSYCMTLFDVPLHFHLADASNSYDQYDMSKIFEGTLTRIAPQSAVAFVDNHDTQPGQALQSWVQDWFKVHAYALILLRDTHCPCVFYGDYKGIAHDQKGQVPFLEEMVWIRKYVFDADQIEDRLDDRHCIGWCAKGIHPIVVVLTNGWASQKTFSLPEHVFDSFVDITRNDYKIQIDKDGSGTFTCLDGKCSIYIKEEDFISMKKEMKR